MLLCFVLAIFLSSALGAQEQRAWVLRDSHRCANNLIRTSPFTSAEDTVGAASFVNDNESHFSGSAGFIAYFVGSSYWRARAACMTPSVLEFWVLCFALSKMYVEGYEIAREGLRSYLSSKGAGFVENSTALLFGSCAVTLPILAALKHPQEAACSDPATAVQWATSRLLHATGWDTE